MQDQQQLYQALLNSMVGGNCCVLATVVAVKGSAASKVGDKAIIENDRIKGWVGGGCCQGIVIKQARNLQENFSHQRNHARLIRVCPRRQFVADVECYESSCPSEGSVDILLEAVGQAPTVLLYGDTPIAQSVASQTQNLSYQLNWQRDATDMLLDDVVETKAQVAIIATQGKGDLVALQHALSTKVVAILLVCSIKKSLALLERLKAQGVEQAELNRIIAHAGLDIGATCTAEIALSLIAQAVSIIRMPTALATDPQLDTTEKVSATAPREKVVQAQRACASQASATCCAS